MGNILGALYLSMLFLGIINSRTVKSVASAERAVWSLQSLLPVVSFVTACLVRTTMTACPLAVVKAADVSIPALVGCVRSVAV